MKEKLYSKLCQEQYIRKVAELLYIFLATPNEVEKYPKMMQSNSFAKCVHHYDIKILNLIYSELQLINIKLLIQNKLKELLSELKKFKVQTILDLLEYTKRNYRKIFQSSTKLIASDSDINEAFKSMHQSIVTNINFFIKHIGKAASGSTTINSNAYNGKKEEMGKRKNRYLQRGS